MWYVTCDTWLVTLDMWYMTYDRLTLSQNVSSYGLGVRGDMWQLTCDTWHMIPDTWHVICDKCVMCPVTHRGWWTLCKNFRSLAFMALELRSVIVNYIGIESLLQQKLRCPAPWKRKCSLKLSNNDESRVKSQESRVKRKESRIKCLESRV